MRVVQTTGDAKAAGTTQVNTIVLADLDSYRKDNRTMNAIVADTFGNLAQTKFYAGELVAVNLQLGIHEYEGRVFQDITVREIVKL